MLVFLNADSPARLFVRILNFLFGWLFAMLVIDETYKYRRLTKHQRSLLQGTQLPEFLINLIALGQ